MKKTTFSALAATIAALVLLASCSHETSGWDEPVIPEENESLFTEQPALATLVLQSESALLSCEAKGEAVTYQWYECTDGTGNGGTPIMDATGQTFSTEAFTVPEIRYYYCVATADGKNTKSRVAAVAYTGLPALYFDLDCPLASVTKDNYALGKMRLVYTDGTEDFEYEFTNPGDEGVKGRGNASWAWEKKGLQYQVQQEKRIFRIARGEKVVHNIKPLRQDIAPQ